jgi:DsbC/DsbD-like thiol-disulfide interchange protein
VRERHFEQSYRNRPIAADFLESSFNAESTRAKVRAQTETHELQATAWLGTDTYYPYQKLQVHLGVQVRPGLHIFGEPIPDGYVPLSVEVATLEGLEVRALELPAPRPFQVDGLDEQFQIYEGELTGSLPLSINQNSGDLDLTLRLRYQACSDNECFPPRTIELRLPLQARDNVRD